MRKIVLFGLGLSLTAASFAGCGDPGDGTGAGDESANLADGAQAPAENDAGADAGGSSSGSLGNGSAASAIRNGFDERVIAAGLGGSRVVIPFALSLTAANGSIIGSSVTGSGPYSASLILSGFTTTGSQLYCAADSETPGVACTVAMAVANCGATSALRCTVPAFKGVLIRVNAGASAPTASCTDAAGLYGSGTLASPVTPSSFVASTGTGTVPVTGLPLGTYTVRVCAVDRLGNEAVGVTTFVTAPGTALPASGTITAATVSAKGATDPNAYDAYLNLTGFTDDTAIAGLRVRVNTGAVTAPALGCNVAGNFNPVLSDQGALNSVGQTSFPTGPGAGGTGGVGFTLASGAGALKIRGLTTPPGTITSYYVRVCAVDASAPSNTPNGAIYVVNVKDDVTPPADGTIDASKVTYDGTDGHIPLTSGWTDDRAVDHLVLRVNSGLTPPVVGCLTPGIIRACVGGANIADICKADSDCPNSTCAVSAAFAARSDRASVAATTSPANLVAAVPYVAAAVGGGATGFEILVPMLIEPDAGKPGNQYTARVCSVDAAGKTSNGTTVRITVKDGTNAQPTGRTFSALATALQETVYAVSPIVQANYATASLSVQCPNPAATPTLNDSELGTTVSTTPPFAAGTCTATPTFSCGAAAGFTNQPNRCKVTTAGVADPCATATKKLAVAIDCDVETVRTASSVLVAGSVLNNTAGNATLTLTCPNTGDTITAVTGDYGDPEIAGTTIVPNVDCNAASLTDTCLGGADDGESCVTGASCDSTVCSATTDYDTAIAAILASCTGDHSCTIPQGLSALTPVTAGSTGTVSCPTIKRTAAVITCRGTYATSHAVTLQLTGAAAAGDEVCISNTPLVSEGTSGVVKGSCGTGWKALVGTPAAVATQTALAAGSYAWTLAPGDGLKTVYIKTHDAGFNESDVLLRTIAVDEIAPSRTGLTAKADGLGVRTPAGTFRTSLVSWNNFLESGAGVASYKLVYTTDGSLPPTDCSAGHCSGGTNIGGACTVATQGVDCPSSTCALTELTTIGDWYDHLSDEDHVVSKPTGSNDPFVHDVEYVQGPAGSLACNATAAQFNATCTVLTDNADCGAAAVSGVGKCTAMSNTRCAADAAQPGAVCLPASDNADCGSAAISGLGKCTLTAGVATAEPLTATTKYVYRVCATDRVGRGSTLLLSSDASPTDFPAATYAPGSHSSAIAASSYVKPILGGSFSIQDRDGSDQDASTMPNLISFGGSSWSSSIYVDVVTDRSGAEGLTATVGSGGTIASYCFSTSSDPASCKDWNAVADLVNLDPTVITVDTGFANPAGVALTGGDGLKTYYVHARDTLGNVTAKPSTISATIKLDKTAPANPTTFTTVSTGIKEVTVSWSLPTDSGSGLAAYTATGSKAYRVPYKIVFAKSQSITSSVSAPVDCNSGTLLNVEASELATAPALNTIVQGATAGGGTGTFNVTALSTGFTYAYRLCVTDLVGNRSAGITRTVKSM